MSWKPEDDEVDVQPYEGKPDFDKPQGGTDGKQDD
jgi:hypothetical protein